ncbi:MAG: type IV secretory system conjugative DNA transfer family protein [Nitrospira sp.]|nr:type IV secretory system conjugative DNA transfer family protein [Nitrospira sp.]
MAFLVKLRAMWPFKRKPKTEEEALPPEPEAPPPKPPAPVLPAPLLPSTQQQPAYKPGFFERHPVLEHLSLWSLCSSAAYGTVLYLGHPEALPLALLSGTGIYGGTLILTATLNKLAVACQNLFTTPVPEYKDLPYIHHKQAYGSGRMADPQKDRVCLGKSDTGVFFGRSTTQAFTYTDHKGRFGRERKILLGGQDGPFVYSTPNAHCLVCAPTRSGKGIGILVPTLLANQNSILAIDPKGELAAITARQRQRLGQQVFLLNPWRLHEKLFHSYGLTQFHSFNPLDILDTKDPAIVSNSMFLASLLVTRSASSDPFWDQSAESLLSGLMLYVAEKEPARKKLPRIRQILNRPQELENALISMAASEAFHGTLADMGHTFLEMAKSEKTKASVISTAQSHLKFLLDPIAAAALDTSTFSFSTLKEKPTSVFLIIPPEYLHSHARWLRLMVGAAMKAFLDPAPVTTRCLFILEEFASLGHMQAIQDGVSTMAGYGIDFLFILQDLSQLQTLYGKAADTFIANSAFRFFTNISDMTTAKYVSDCLGKSTVTVNTINATGGQNSGLTSKPVASPDELLREGIGPAYLFQPGTFPTLLNIYPYYKDQNFKTLADPNPFRPKP